MVDGTEKPFGYLRKLKTGYSHKLPYGITQLMPPLNGEGSLLETVAPTLFESFRQGMSYIYVYTLCMYRKNFKNYV